MLLSFGVVLVILVIVRSGDIPTATAITETAAEAETLSTGLRPDAPPYAVHGPYAVGMRDFVIQEGDHEVSITIWYPGLNQTQAPEEINYQIAEKIDMVPPLPPAMPRTLKGRALEDAAPDTAQGPYPLVIFSPGLAGFRQQNSFLLEHLASYGFVVISGDPRGETLFEDFWLGAATRPLDTQLTIAYAEKLTAPAGELAGLIDMEKIAVSGHSAGASFALVGGGAQMDFGWCAAHSDIVAAQEFQSNCTQSFSHQQEIAAMLELKSTPTGMWPPLNDPRIDAVVALAPDGDIWGAEYGGVAVMKVPTLIMGGSEDTAQVPEHSAYLIYEHLGSPKKSHVVFENADHFIFFSQCRDIPWGSEIPYFICSDPVWDMDRAHDLINHFVTAFLLAELKDDAEAKKVLVPENVMFPGITYETTEASSEATSAAITIVQKFYEALNQKKIDEAMSYVADDMIMMGGQYTGKEQIRKWVEDTVQKGDTFGLSDLKDEGGRVTYTVNVSNNGKVVYSGPGVDIVKNGKIVVDE
jgi:predicted dienelactone hydrolase